MNPLRELAANGHDLRKLGWNKLPSGHERVGLLFMNTQTHMNEESAKTCAKIAKLMKYMQMEVFFVSDPTVDEFINAMRHFITDVSEYLFCFYCGTKIHQSLANQPSVLKMRDGDIDPELLYDLMNSKIPESKVAFLMDGITSPEKWDPSKNNVNREGVIVIAPYADPSQNDTQQFDSTMNGFFAVELSKIIKSDPEMTGESLTAALNQELSIVGMKVYCASYPAEFKSELSFAI